MFKTPLPKRLQRSAWFKRRYREDEQFRLARINANRRKAGKELLKSAPPVGQARREWAAARQRDEKGRFA